MASAEARPGVQPTTRQRTLSVAGAAGVAVLPVFVGTVIVLTWLEWDFLHGTGWTVLHEHQVNYPSALGRGDLGLLQSLNFLVLGGLALIFWRGLRSQFIHRASGAIATIGFVGIGLSGLFSAFVTDLPGEPVSWHGTLHGIGFVMLMLGSAVALPASGLALRGAPAWRGYWVYSLLNVPLAVAVSVALSPLGQVSFYALVIVLLAWFTVVGIRLRQIAGHSA